MQGCVSRAFSRKVPTHENELVVFARAAARQTPALPSSALETLSMKRRSILVALIGAAAAVSFAGTSVLAFAGVSNGSFEAGTPAPGEFEVLTVGATQMTGWTISAGSVDWIGTYWVSA